MRCIRVFSALQDLIRYSPNRRILTEMTIIRACRSAMDDGAEEGGTLLLDKIKNRVREMETQIYNNEMAIEAIAGGAASTGFGGAGHSGAGKVGGEKETSADSSREPAVAQELPPALPEEIREIVSNWSQYASEAPHGSRRLALRNARLSLGDHGQLLIIFEKEYGNPYIYQRRDDNGESSRRVDDDRRQLQQYLQGKVGKAIEIEYRVLDRGGRITDNYVDLLSLVEPGAIRMSVETEDM
jgi:DNA polymerase-3 subunit gamma/tau